MSRVWILIGALPLVWATSAEAQYDRHSDAKIALHAQPVARGLSCSMAPAGIPCSDFVTNASTHAGYELYMVVGQFTEVDALGDPAGVAGIGCGIAYDGVDGRGADVFRWTLCADLSFPSSTWPASGSGIRLIWDHNMDCQTTVVGGDGVHAVAGSFYVYAYGEDVFQITPHLKLVSGPELAVVECSYDALTYELDPDARGAVRFSESGTEPGYNPCSGVGTLPEVPEPPSTPPPPSPVDYDGPPAVVLHVSPDAARTVGCDDGPATPEDVNTVAPIPEGGADYSVFILGVPGQAGIQVGLSYDGANDIGRGIRVIDWQSCEAEVQSDHWPAPGSGNLLVWSECPRDGLPVGGIFTIAVYEPSVFALGPHPNTGDIRVGSCYYEEIELAPVPEQQVGWISLGGASLGVDSDGCNPLLGPCSRTSVATVPTTWGALKSRY